MGESSLLGLWEIPGRSRGHLREDQAQAWVPSNSMCFTGGEG